VEFLAEVDQALSGPVDLHCLGGLAVLAYQLRELGGAQRKSVSGWRLFDLSKIEAARSLKNRFAAVAARPISSTTPGACCTRE
jgi:hypothetical protein